MTDWHLGYSMISSSNKVIIIIIIIIAVVVGAVVIFITVRIQWFYSWTKLPCSLFSCFFFVFFFFSILFSIVITSHGEERAGLCASRAIASLRILHAFMTSFFSFCQGLAAACNWGSPWTFLLTVLSCIYCL